jgi:hypothetical protein
MTFPIIDRNAARNLADILADDYGIATEPWAFGLFVGEGLCVYVGRLTGAFRWFEAGTAMRHPVEDPAGAAERIATRASRLLEAAS